MIQSLVCSLLVALLQASPATPPVIEGASLPTVTLETPDEHGGLRLYRFSPDGSRLAGATGVGTYTSNGESSKFGGEVLLWNPVTGKLVKVLGAHRMTPTMLQFSSDGTRLLSYSRADHNARLWSVSDGRLLADVSLSGPGSREQPPVLSPDGTILLHLAERTLDLADGIDVSYLLEAWHLEEGRRLWTRTAEEPTGQLDARFAISPDGSTVALSRKETLWKVDGKITSGKHLASAHELLAIDSGTPIWSIPLKMTSRKRSHPAKQLLFTPDGSGILMVGRETMHHYGVTDGKPVGEPIDLEAEDSVDAVHFSKDGRHFMVTRFFDRQFDVHAFPGGAELFRVSFAFPDKLQSPYPSPDLRRVVGQLGFSDPVVIDLTSGFASGE